MTTASQPASSSSSTARSEEAQSSESAVKGEQSASPKAASSPGRSTVQESDNFIGSCDHLGQVLSSTVAKPSSPDSPNPPSPPASQGGVLIALVLLLIGHFVSHLFSHSREIRKECKTEVDACIKLTVDLFEQWRHYMTEPADSSTAAEESGSIRFSFHRLAKRIERLEERYGGFKVAKELDNFSETLTGGDFDSANRAKRERSDPLFLALDVDTNSLVDALESEFSKRFPARGLRTLLRSFC